MAARLNPQGQGRLDSLQWVRAIAAASVALGHIVYEAGKYTGLDTTLQRVSVWIPYEIGVDLFFILSGFIMVYVSRDRLSQGGYWWYFLRARIARIVPIYWFYTAIMAAALLIVPERFDSIVFTTERLVHSLTFFPGWTFPSVGPILGPGWTLNYEMFFYAVFALGILAFGRWAFVAVLVVLPALSVMHLLGLFDASLLLFWSRPLILEFCFGMALALLYQRGVSLSPVQGALMIVGSIVLLALMMQTQLYADRRIEFDTRAIYYGLPSLMFVAAFALTREWSSSDSLVGRMATHMGDASYTLYLSHLFVIRFCTLVWREIGFAGPLLEWGFVLFAFLVVLIAAPIAYRVVEQPLDKVARRLLLPRTRRREAP